MAATSPLLVIRFSALGDVAMTVPVLKLLLEQNPSQRIVMVSNSSYAPLFENIDRLTFLGADLSARHRGLSGLLKLFVALRKAGPFMGVADLHHVIRSRLLCLLFFMTGVSSYHIEKGRTQKRALTRRYNKHLQPLPSAFERMQVVFLNMGLHCSLPSVSAPAIARFAAQKAAFTIGIAPFAKHPEKAYPLSQLKDLIGFLQADGRFTIQLFGGGGAEALVLAQYEKEYRGVVSMAGRFTLAEELAYMRKLDLMISMDSANMHLASLCDLPVLSVWGPTHRFAGFMGWGQSEKHAIEAALECRPCSVFGNKACYRGDHACMQQIKPEHIAAKLYQTLGLSARISV